METLARITALYAEKSAIYRDYQNLEPLFVRTRLSSIEFSLRELWAKRRRELCGPATILRKKRHKYLELY